MIDSLGPEGRHSRGNSSGLPVLRTYNVNALLYSGLTARAIDERSSGPQFQTTSLFLDFRHWSSYLEKVVANGFLYHY